MEIVLSRRWRGKNTTLSTLLVDGGPHHFVLEDTDRQLDTGWPIEEIQKTKVFGQTAIPTGRYQVIINYSVRFKRRLPLLLNVPGFEGIRIHPGNRHVDTNGCLLPGITYRKDVDDYVVGSSRIAFEKLNSAIEAVLKKGEVVWIEVRGDWKN